MTTYVVTTQTLENYGAHGGSGKFTDGKAYWKCKGGNDIIVKGLDRYQDAWAFVAAIAPSTVAWKEIPVSVQEYWEWEADLSEKWKDDEAYQFFLQQAQKRTVDPSDPSSYKNLGW